jgi:hypothetical protein
VNAAAGGEPDLSEFLELRDGEADNDRDQKRYKVAGYNPLSPEVLRARAAEFVSKQQVVLPVKRTEMVGANSVCLHAVESMQTIQMRFNLFT